MLRTIALVVVLLWMLGLETGFTMGSFIHIFIVTALALLVISLSQEVMINQKLRNVLRSCCPKPDQEKRAYTQFFYHHTKKRSNRYEKENYRYLLLSVSYADSHRR